MIALDLFGYPDSISIGVRITFIGSKSRIPCTSSGSYCRHLIIMTLLSSLFLLHLSSCPVVPSSCLFPTSDTVSVNGSSTTGNCSEVTSNGLVSICADPTSSVLYDSNIPTLSGLDGDMWASQILTVQPYNRFTEVTFDFTFTPGYEKIKRVEVAIFNCPEWGTAIRSIILQAATSAFGGSRDSLATIRPTITSCDSLVRYCIQSTNTLPVFVLFFTLSSGSNWLHLAEVAFYNDNTACPPAVAITTPPPPATTTSQPEMTTESEY